MNNLSQFQSTGTGLMWADHGCWADICISSDPRYPAGTGCVLMTQTCFGRWHQVFSCAQLILSPFLCVTFDGIVTVRKQTVLASHGAGTCHHWKHPPSLVVKQVYVQEEVETPRCSSTPNIGCHPLVKTPQALLVPHTLHAVKHPTVLGSQLQAITCYQKTSWGNRTKDTCICKNNRKLISCLMFLACSYLQTWSWRDPAGEAPAWTRPPRSVPPPGFLLSHGWTPAGHFRTQRLRRPALWADRSR